MKKSFFLAILMLIIFGMSCPAQSNNPFEGTWSGIDEKGEKVIFVSEGSTWGIFYEDEDHWFVGSYTISGNTAKLIELGEEISGSATVSRNNLTVVMEDKTGWSFPEGSSIIFTKQIINNDARKQFEGTWTGYVGSDYTELAIAGSTWRRSVNFFNDSGTYLFYGNSLILIDSDETSSLDLWSGTVAGNGMRFEYFIGLRRIKFTLFRR
jgi:hypothetical protein